MNIGLHAWEPGLTEAHSTSSSGGSTWVRYLIDKLNEAGHHIYWLPNTPTPDGTIGAHEENFHHLETAVFFWRWEMPNYPERQALYKSQWEWIDLLYKTGAVRLIVHDQDHKISEMDRKVLATMGAEVYAPELQPRQGVQRLMFPYPYENDRDTHTGLVMANKPAIRYIGNNYERFGQAVEFFSFLSKNKGNVEVWGNWMEAGPDRADPETVRSLLPNVKFMGRAPQSAVVKLLAGADFTIHLHKESYGPCGFLTMRWAEAVAAGTPAFIPDSVWLPQKWANAMKRSIVHTGVELALTYSLIQLPQWKELLDAQRRFVKHYFTIDRWLEVLEKRK